MSGDNLYPTIDSMNLDDVILYFNERRNIKIYTQDYIDDLEKRIKELKKENEHLRIYLPEWMKERYR